MNCDGHPVHAGSRGDEEIGPASHMPSSALKDRTNDCFERQKQRATSLRAGTCPQQCSMSNQVYIMCCRIS